VILDACRNNPLPKTRGMDRGLARIDAASGTFIAFAAAPGQTAQDGDAGHNGVFTGEFIKAMAEPGLPLELLFKKVVAGVKADTKGEQTPWSESSIQGDFSFYSKNASSAAVAGANAAAVAATPNAPARHVDNAAELEQSFWERIKDSNDPADFNDYKTQYPNGAHVAEANVALRKLGRSSVASAAPPPQAAPATRSAAPQAASNPTVDPAAVGHWTMKVGASTWFWDVKANGTYSSWSVGAQPGSHSGTVSVANGHWSLNATTMSWVDGGTYKLMNPDTLVVTGRLGTGAWLRVK
jgi:hypothetical protein